MLLQLEVGKTYKFTPQSVVKTPTLNLQSVIVEVKEISISGSTILIYNKEWEREKKGHGGGRPGLGHWFLYGEDPKTYHEFLYQPICQDWSRMNR